MRLHLAHCPLPLHAPFPLLTQRNFVVRNEGIVMDERDLSARAREAWMKKEEQSHETVLRMLRKLDGPTEKDEGLNKERSPLKSATKENCVEDGGVVRRRTKADGAGGVNILRNRRMGKFVESLPSEEEVEEMEEDLVSSEDVKADWRLSRMGPKVLSYEPAPWEEEQPQQTNTNQLMPSAFERDSGGLGDIVEDEEDSESLQTQYADVKPKLLTPPAEYAHPSSPHAASHVPIYKLPSDVFPAPTTPVSLHAPTSPVSDSSVPRSPPAKSLSNLRSRAGLKKIFLSSLRPRKRVDIEPLSPTLTISSSVATTPSLPTPTIRITSPFHPRRVDGSPLDDHPMMEKLSPVETGYRLPELRLSRADWGEWGRQVAERI